MGNRHSRIILFFLLLFSIHSHAQFITFSGQVGYARPQGEMFKDNVTGERLGSFGLGYDADVLWCFDKLDNKLAAGITYVGNAVFGMESSTGLDLGMYGLSLYGVKGLYRLRTPDKSVSPYAALGLGLSELSTADIYSGETLVAEGKSSFSFGLRPEIGFDLGGFLLSASYLVPMKYNVKSETGDFSGTAGALSISIGYRYYLSIKGGYTLEREGRIKDNVSEEYVEEKTESQGIGSRGSDAEKEKKAKKEKAGKNKQEKNVEHDDEAEDEDATYEKNNATRATKTQSNVKQESTTPSVSNQENNYGTVPQNNAEAVRVSPDARVTYENPNFKVGEKVLYKMRDRVYTATIVSFIGNSIAVVEMENGAEVKRYLKDLVKASK